MGRFSKWKSEYQAKLIFADYYKNVQEDIKQVLKSYKSQGRKIAIWSADPKGIAFLRLMDSDGKYISYVIDMDKRKWGHQIVGREIISYSNISEKEIDVVFILNQRHFVQNYNILKDEGLHCIVHDADEIVKKNLSFEEIKRNDDMKDDIQEKIELTQIIQKELLPILKEVKRVCEKNNITYFLCAGSTLGAVRHKGFIPWDDDIDIGMLRSDYEKFLKIADKELKSGFILMNGERSPDYYVAHAKVFRDNTALVNNETSHLRLHHGFYLDLFPFDTIPEDEESQDKLYWEQREAKDNYVFMKKKKKYDGKNPIKKYFANERYYLANLKSSKKAFDKVNQVMMSYQTEDPKYVADFFAPYGKKLFFKYDDIVPTREAEFEGEMYPIPGNSERYLEIMYGDYMTLPPEDKRFVKHNLIKIDMKNNYEPDEKWLKKYRKKYKIT